MTSLQTTVLDDGQCLAAGAEGTFEFCGNQKLIDGDHCDGK